MHQPHFHIPHQEKRVIDAHDDNMSSSIESSFSESNSGPRLLSIVFKSKRVNRSIFPYRVSFFMLKTIQNLINHVNFALTFLYLPKNDFYLLGNIKIFSQC